MTEITLPFNWSPWKHQRELLAYRQRGGTRAVCCWHRRGGKDITAFNSTIMDTQKRVGLYWHMLPTFRQGRKVVWNGITNDGKKFRDYIPPELIKRSLDQEMMIEFTNGSIWQVVGSDDIDRLVGANPIGVVYSEYSLTNPAAWDMVRPILAANGGWVIFIFTARGINHAHALLRYAETNPEWLAQVITVDDTVRPDGLPIVPLAAINEDRAAGMAEEIVRQEYWCSFDAPLIGSYYGPQMQRMKDDGRICELPYDETLPVHTAWDIGVGDSTSITFFQIRRDGWIHFIDYIEKTGTGLQKWVKILQEKDYTYGTHLGPHDLKNREWGNGAKTRIETARGLGLKFDLVPKLSIADGIDAVRGLLNRVRIDKKNCSVLVDILKQYKRKLNSKIVGPAGEKLYDDKPQKDWTSHGADSVRYLAIGLEFCRNKFKGQENRPTKSNYNMFTHLNPAQNQNSRYNIWRR